MATTTKQHAADVCLFGCLHQPNHFIDYSFDLPHDLSDGRVKKVWKREKSKRVSGGCRVEHDAREFSVLLVLDELNHLGDGDGHV